MKKEWFESWFESDLYDLMYQHRNDEEARRFLSKLLNTLNPIKEARFLDLACGTGRHSRFIHEQGYQVTGIDLSNRNINIASQFASDNLEFFIQDMRKPFRINYFDYVLNIFTSFGYFDDAKDNLRVIKGVKSSLKKSGIFVIDYLNKAYTERHLIGQEEKVFEDWTVYITRSVKENRLIKTMEWTNGQIDRNYAEKVSLFTFNEFESMLSTQQFEIIASYGDYELGEYDELNSPRIILVCSC